MLVVVVVIMLLYTPKSTPSYHDNFKVEINSNRENWTSHVSKILCTIDLKFISIYFEMESKPQIVDDIIGGTSGCVPGASIMLIG